MEAVKVDPEREEVAAFGEAAAALVELHEAGLELHRRETQAEELVVRLARRIAKDPWASDAQAVRAAWAKVAEVSRAPGQG